MAQKDADGIVTHEELLIANTFELDALVELLTRKGIVTRQELLVEIQRLRRTTPRAQRPEGLESPLPELKQDTIVKHILDVFNATGVTADQAKDVLRHVEALVELGQRIAQKAH